MVLFLPLQRNPIYSSRHDLLLASGPHSSLTACGAVLLRKLFTSLGEMPDQQSRKLETQSVSILVF